MKTSASRQRHAAAFTLVELMTSCVIIAILLYLLVQMTGQASNTWSYTVGKAEQFREARAAFETMTRRISQATLNTYWDYDDPNAPKAYTRCSELRFICGPMQSQLATNKLDASAAQVRPAHGIFFHAPFGFEPQQQSETPLQTTLRRLDSSLNTWGYYLEVNDDSALRPQHVDAPLRIRSRLMELMQPASAVSIYKYTSGSPGSGVAAIRNYQGFGWFQDALAKAVPDRNASGAAQNPTAHALAENIIALAILPKLSEQDLKDPTLGSAVPTSDRDAVLAPRYFYHSAVVGEAAGKSGPLAGLLNSKHQLPPVVQVTMVAIDERSAGRLKLHSAAADPFQVGPSTAFLTNAKNYRKDLFLDPSDPDADCLEKRLIAAKVNYRVFTSNVIIRGSKWSHDQVQ